MTTFNTKNRIDFLFIFDCLDGNPNGDPNMDNLPRQDPETGHGLVSDVAIKRRIRDYVEATGKRIYVKAGTALDETRDEAYQALGVDDGSAKDTDDGKKKKAKGLAKKDTSIDSLRDWMCEKFYDIRTFGAVMSQSKKNCGQVRGPVQITFSRSIDPIVPMSQAITVCAAQTGAEDKENQTMGRKAMMPYGLYVGRGFFSPALANQTGFSSDDFKLLTMLQGDRVDQEIDLPDKSIEWANEFERLNAERKVYEAKAKAMKAESEIYKSRLLQMMGNKNLGKIPDGRKVRTSLSSKKGFVMPESSWVNLKMEY
jgi:CRISPR-associated protein Csd2